mmetsp:Transcript_13433/g.15606  ORF Transcript_13433/g.15606 Transcript_13433/m.15606 type:complete len:536 (+) Transcript_13433:92-1699(+)
MIRLEMMACQAFFTLALLVLVFLSVCVESVTKPKECKSENVSLELDLENGARLQLTLNSANERVMNTEYAVRGVVLMRALEIEEALQKDSSAYPFDAVVKCNIGNPQALGQKPITFTRQVLSLVMNPELLTEESIVNAYPADAISRAQKYLDFVKSVGAYSASNGVAIVRDEVSEFLKNRDSVKVNPNDIFLTSGASEAVEMLMRVLIRSNNDAVLTPIPQYPLYSALTTVLDGYFAGYYMGDETKWELNMAEVKKALFDARNLGKTVRAMVVINPGNPTGSVLSIENMKEIINFCVEEKLLLLADEVYQRNIYTGKSPFISFRRVANQMGTLSDDGTLLKPLQLASFHSTSKGVVGECGLRGGFVDLLGFSNEIKEQVYKLASIKLCSNVPGQIAVGLMVNPPREGDVSYPKYAEETTGIHASLFRRAKRLETVLNSLPGINCKPIEGALYAFPQITLPDRYTQKAEEEGVSPDTKYAIEVLESTGVVVVPGNGFGQRNGSYHFRTTFLPPEDIFDQVLERFSAFHSKFMEEWL